MWSGGWFLGDCAVPLEGRYVPLRGRHIREARHIHYDLHCGKLPLEQEPYVHGFEPALGPNFRVCSRVSTLKTRQMQKDRIEIG
jgi:hypothetical protein